MAERQTLGDSILFGAADWEAARSEGGVMAGREEWDTLCKLAARADAAERLALACVGVEDVASAGDGAAWADFDDEADDALAAFRAVLAEGG